MKQAEQYWRPFSWVVVAANALLAVLLIAVPDRLSEQLLFGGLLGFGVRLYLYLAGHVLGKPRLQFSLYGLEFCSAGLLVRWKAGPLWAAELLLVLGILIQVHIVLTLLKDITIDSFASGPRS